MDGVRVIVTARTMEGTAATDPDVMIRVDEAQPFQRVLGTESIKNFSDMATYDMAAPGGGNIQWMVTP